MSALDGVLTPPPVTLPALSSVFECPVCLRLYAGKDAPSHEHDGVRVRLKLKTEPFAPEPLDVLEAEVRLVEPRLLQTDWPPMTYMLIPSVLETADLLLHRILASRAQDPVRAPALFEKLYSLRKGFRRLK